MSNLLNKYKKHCTAFAAAALISVGGQGPDVLTDQGGLHEIIQSLAGDDIFVYTPSLNRQDTDFYDGGTGNDTLWLRVTDQEAASPAFRADMIRAYTFIDEQAMNASADPDDRIFKFDTFGLSFRHVEHILVEPISAYPEPEKKLPAPLEIKNQGDDLII